MDAIIFLLIQVPFALLFWFSVTSMLLAGSIFEPVREWWIKKFEKSRMKDLSYCALCLGFWISLSTQWILIDFYGLLLYVMISFISAGLTWVLYSTTQTLLWSRCYLEYLWNKGIKHDLEAEDYEKKKIGFRNV